MVERIAALSEKGHWLPEYVTYVRDLSAPLIGELWKSGVNEMLVTDEMFGVLSSLAQQGAKDMRYEYHDGRLGETLGECNPDAPVTRELWVGGVRIHSPSEIRDAQGK